MSEPTHATDLAAIGPDASGPMTAFAALQGVRRRETRQGKPYFDLRLSDRTRTVAGKVWSDATGAMQAVSQLEVGAHVKVLFECDDYQGALQLNVRRIRPAEPGEPGYEPAALREDGIELVEDIVCGTVVCDIETVPAVDLRQAPPTIAQAVAKHAERTDADDAKVMGLSPFFGQVVSLAVGDGELDPDDQTVTVFVVPPPGPAPKPFPKWIRAVSEPELLRAFWALAGRAEVVVTYNGRGFDVPFMVIRSLIHGVPVRTDLLSHRNMLRPHLDLFRVLTRGGRMGPSSLDVVCWSLGLASPKQEMDGSMVAPTYQKGDVASIALYNAGDVRATIAVYQRVRDGILRYSDDW